MWNPFNKPSSYEFGNWSELPSVTVASAEEVYSQKDHISLPPDISDDSFSKTLHKVVRGILLALIVLVPIFLTPFTWPSDILTLNKEALIYGLVFISAVLWLVMVVRQGGVRLKTSGIELAILAYLAANLLAALFSQQVYESFISGNGFMMVASLTIFAFLLLNFFEKKEISRLSNYFISGSFLALLVGVLSLYHVPIFQGIKWFPSSQLNTIGSINSLSALGVLALVLVLSSYFGLSSLAADRKPMFLIKAGTAILSAILILVTNWSIFYLVLAVGMLGVLINSYLTKISLGAEAKFRAKNLIGPLAITSLSLLFLVGFYFFNFNFPGRQNLPLEVGLSQRGSFDIVRSTLSLKTPWGVGQNNFSLVFDKFKPSGINNSVFWNTRFGNAASGFWNLVIETGWLGLISFAFLIFSLLFSVLWPKNQWRSAYLTAVFPVFISTLTLFFLYPFNLVLNFWFWGMIGLWLLGIERELKPESIIVMDEISPRSIFSSLGFVLILVFGMAGGYLMVKRYQGEFYFSQAARMNLASAGDVDKATNLLDQSINSDSKDLRYLNGLAQLFLIKINAEVSNKKDKPEDVRTRIQNLVRLTVQTASQITADNPRDAQNWSTAGLIYENLMALSVGGADQAALNAYAEYAKRAPNDPAIYTRIGNIYLQRADLNSNALANARNNQQKIQNEKEVVDMTASDYKKAEENFQKAVDLKNDLSAALYNLGVVYDREAKTKNAIKQLELTKILDPNNPGLAFELGLLYYRDGQKDSALSEMARAVNLDQNYANAHWYLALLLEERGQIDLAIEQLKQILSIDANKDNQTVKDKLAALEAGHRELPPAKVTSKKPLEQSPKTPR